MNKVEINSIEAVILFILYICAQDDVIAEEELDQLALELPLLQKLYLDMYGEFIDEDLTLLTKDIAKKLIAEHKFIGSKITSGEKALFSKLLTDPKLQDVALLSARHAASADGLHNLESKKFNYWLQTWGL